MIPLSTREGLGQKSYGSLNKAFVFVANMRPWSRKECDRPSHKCDNGLDRVKVIRRKFEIVFWCLEWECCTVQNIDENSFKSTNTVLWFECIYPWSLPGMFPYAMLATTTVFYSASWPRALCPKLLFCLRSKVPSLDQTPRTSDSCIYPSSKENSKVRYSSLTLIRLGYFGGWKDWGGHDGPPLRSQPWIARSPRKFAQW